MRGYEVYSCNPDFINKFLVYYSDRNGVTVNLAKPSEENNISAVLQYRNRRITKYLENTSEEETIALAKLIVK